MKAHLRIPKKKEKMETHRMRKRKLPGVIFVLLILGSADHYLAGRPIIHSKKPDTKGVLTHGRAVAKYAANPKIVPVRAFFDTRI